MKKGLVYIIMNPAFHHLIKIGRTTKKDIEEKCLNASNVPEDFEIIKVIEVDDCKKVEEQLHKDFDQFRHETETGRKTEYFYIGCLDNAKKTLASTKDYIDIIYEVGELIIDKSEKADEDEIIIDQSVNDWISWEDIRNMRDPKDKIIVEENAKLGQIIAVNWLRITIVKQAKKEGKWKDRKLSKQWLIDSGYMDKLMKIQWID